MKSLSLLLALALGLCTPLAYSQAQDGGQLQILASIRPLALIAEDLLGDVARIDVLIKGNASPHDYSLKMSDLRRLEAADLVLWMGPELERFLQKPLRALPAKQVLSLAQEQDSLAGDPHQWLDPALARGMSQAIAAKLKSDFPRLASQLDRRLAEQLARYRDLEEEARQALTPVVSRGFVVEHRGYDYFVEAFGLNQLGWISEMPDQPPGVRHLLRLQEELAALPADRRARCLFVEEGHHSRDADTLGAELGLEVASLDILGFEADSYAALIRHLVRDVRGCLGKQQVAEEPRRQ